MKTLTRNNITQRNTPIAAVQNDLWQKEEQCHIKKSIVQ